MLHNRQIRRYLTKWDDWDFYCFRINKRWCVSVLSLFITTRDQLKQSTWYLLSFSQYTLTDCEWEKKNVFNPSNNSNNNIMKKNNNNNKKEHVHENEELSVHTNTFCEMYWINCQCTEKLVFCVRMDLKASVRSRKKRSSSFANGNSSFGFLLDFVHHFVFEFCTCTKMFLLYSSFFSSPLRTLCLLLCWFFFFLWQKHIL